MIAALLALPLALLADGGSAAAMCNGYCCLPHGGHAAQMQMANGAMSEEKTDEGMACHRGALGHFLDCSMKSSSRGTDYSILAPLPPTNLSSATALLLALVSGRATCEIVQDAMAGFSSAPLEPPRA